MKRISKKTETHNELSLTWYTVSYQPSVRHIKDKQVRENTKKVRTSHRVHKDNLKQMLDDLKRNRLTHIEVIPDIVKLPLKCPVCHSEGSPTIINDKRANKFSTFDFQGNRIKQYEKYLRYNHTKGKSSCRIAKYKIIKIKHEGKMTKEIPSLVLRKSLKPGDLGLR